MSTGELGNAVDQILRALRDDREQEGTGLGLDALRLVVGTTGAGLETAVPEAIEQGLIEPAEPDRFVITDAGMRRLGDQG